MYAHIILSSASKHIDRIFHYRIPETLKEKILLGSQVSIPFGRRQTIGYVVGFSEKAEVPNTKDITEVLSPAPLFNEKQLDLAKWISQYYGSFFITALRLIMPPGTKQRENRSSVRVTKAVSSTGIATDRPPSNFTLTPEQENALEKVGAAMRENQTAKILLFGPAGSGKTEVYLQAIARCLEEGKTAIALVPEIASASQMVQRFKERFGDDLALLHSDKTLKQRDAEWQRVYDGEAQVVIGTRSVLFAPLKNLGLIVMDEEHESSYKQDQSPRYHARGAAEKLAELHCAVLLLGSTAPSIETYYYCRSGKYGLAKLSNRIDRRPLPLVEVVDMRTEKGILSKRILEEIKTTLDKNAVPAPKESRSPFGTGRQEKVILFLNRRGFFRVSFCERCGKSIKCPNCSVALILHNEGGDLPRLQCAHCEYSISADIICPNCQNPTLSRYGLGTQKIEKDLERLFKKAKILRLDKDSAKKQGTASEILEAFSAGKADLLIGTQMAAKAMNAAEIALVGVINADVSLNIPDFRAGENTFRLLTQASGAAGRGQLPGKVIFQTFNPDHYAVRSASEYDYEGFYESEIKFREELLYPPFSRLVNLEFQGEDKAAAEKTSRMAKKILEKYSEKITILGPAPAPIEKLRGKFRYRILLKGRDQLSLRAPVDEMLEKVIALKGTRITVDIDPVNLS